MNLDIYTPQMSESITRLREIDFELAYLAALTVEGLKPLSRWEKPLNEEALDKLAAIGLQVHRVQRTVREGPPIIETLFSTTPASIRAYKKTFADRPVDKSRATVLLEGYLFGYPPCCVRAYARQPYTPNDLPRRDQEILFHWACKDCTITPMLLAEYRRIHDFVSIG